MLDRPNKAVSVTLWDRLEYGKLSVDETCALSNCSRSQFYRDVIPSLFYQDPWAQSRRPSDMMRQG
jgi:hypothetical protein